MARSISNLSRLAVGAKDAKQALKGDFLVHSDRSIGALFDLCEEDAPAVREIAQAMRSTWFVPVRDSLLKGIAADENQRPQDERWIIEVFNYAYGLGGLKADVASGPATVTPTPAKSNKGIFIGIGAFAGAAVIAGIIISASGHSSPPAKPQPPAIAAVQTKPPETPVDVPTPVVTPPNVVKESEPKPVHHQTRHVAPTEHEHHVAAHHHIASKPPRVATSKPKPEHKVVIEHESPPSE